MSVSTPEYVRTLPAMDAVAEGLLAFSGSLRFAIAESEAERLAVYRLRYEVITARGWARPEELPDGFERDEFDDEAAHLTLWDGDVLAAVARLVFARLGAALPTEQAFEMEMAPHAEFADWGRIAVAPAYRGSAGHTLVWGLLSHCWLETRGHGFSHVCGVLSAYIIKLYKTMGLEFTVLGPGRTYWNEERFATELDVIASAPRIALSLEALRSAHS